MRGEPTLAVEEAGDDLEQERPVAVLCVLDPALPHVGGELGEAADERKDGRTNLADRRRLARPTKAHIEDAVGS